jgi:hypothetical protein
MRAREDAHLDEIMRTKKFNEMYTNVHVHMCSVSCPGV